MVSDMHMEPGDERRKGMAEHRYPAHLRRWTKTLLEHGIRTKQASKTHVCTVMDNKSHSYVPLRKPIAPRFSSGKLNCTWVIV